MTTHPAPLRTLVCQDWCVRCHTSALRRACMSIKEASKRASRESLRRNKPEDLPESTILNPRIQIVIDFMDANLQRKISLSEIAGAANLSRSHVSHLFKTQIGLSPGEYLRRLRMKKARHLLATSMLSVKEIMALAGYNNKSHFLRHFKRSFGLAPTEYRKTIPSVIAKSRQLARLNRKIG